MKKQMACVMLVGLVSVDAAAGEGRFSREFVTDRPDITESAVTVECGRFQWEMSSVSYERGRGEREWRWLDVNAKVGVAGNQDLQVGLSPWVEQREDGDGWRRGVSDVTLRYKVNLVGNDGGDWTLGVMPYVVVPSGSAVSGGRSEQGVILPVSRKLSEVDDLAGMVELGRVWGDGRYEVEMTHSVSWGHDWGKGWGNYLEYAGTVGREYEAVGSFGATWQVSEGWMWDVGATVGLNRAAAKFGCFQGLSFRW